MKHLSDFLTAAQSTEVNVLSTGPVFCVPQYQTLRFVAQMNEGINTVRVLVVDMF